MHFIHLETAASLFHIMYIIGFGGQKYQTKAIRTVKYKNK